MQHYALFKSVKLDSVGVSVSTTRLLRYLSPKSLDIKIAALRQRLRVA